MTRWTLLGTAVALLSAAAPAHAAATGSAVTFVSRTGRDAGTCTRAAPCQTFHYAVTQTAAGGVLAALDRSGYGSVQITQSITILGPGRGGAAMSPPSGNTGVYINAPGGTVVLRGLAIEGGFNGISIGQAATVVISDTVIVGSSNLAINASNTSASVLVQDTSVQNAEVDTNAANFVAKRVTVSGSPSYGINPLAGHVVLDDCTVSGSGSTNIPVYGSTTIVKNCTLPYAGLRGIDVTSGSTAYIDSTTTFGNGQFSVIVGGTAYSYGNNNFTETTSGTITPIAGD